MKTEPKDTGLRIRQHPSWGSSRQGRQVTIYFDGKPLSAIEGEPIAAVLTEAGVRVFRHTAREDHPRGIFCAIAAALTAPMTVNGVPGVA